MSILRLKLKNDMIMDGDFSPEMTGEPSIPDIIELPQDQKVIVIGRASSIANVTVSSSAGKDVISQIHSVITSDPRGNFHIWNYGIKGTFVNYVKVDFRTLHSGDIVCFGHPAGATVKEGQVVEPYNWDLKYEVIIDGPKENEVEELYNALNSLFQN
ncbi:hypothetical protein Aperf_G00000054668 [Anoplocephala perfoliata]